MVSAREVVAAVPDPELPFLTIDDLGILRGVETDGAGRVTVTITPTYSGCPAVAAIRADIRRALASAGHRDVRIDTVLSPAWTTDRITGAGRAKLREAGIAPPTPFRAVREVVIGGIGVPPPRSPDRRGLECPRCGSTDTAEISRFGSTACKSLWRCRACHEPFDHFKALR